MDRLHASFEGLSLLPLEKGSALLVNIFAVVRGRIDEHVEFCGKGNEVGGHSLLLLLQSIHRFG